MAHSIQFSHETTEDAVFTCTVCGTTVGFNKAGVAMPLQGEPHSEFTNGEWVLPADADVYFGECQ